MSSSGVTSNGMVEISAFWNGRKIVLANIREDIISRCSVRVRPILAQQTGTTKGVILTGASPGPLRFVLNHIMVEGENVFIKGHKMASLTQALMVWQACEVLKIQPPQAKLEGWIVQHVAHKKITVAEMQVINHVFDKEHRVWKAMVNQIGWLVNDEKYTVSEIEEIVDAALPYDELFKELDNKVNSLQRPHVFWRERQKKEADRKAYEEKIRKEGQIGGKKP